MLNKTEASTKLKALENASYLCLDQYNGSGKENLKFLNTTYKVNGIIKNINKINFTSNLHHRRYTHRGWDFKYPDDKANWKLRKIILLNTVSKAFGYGNMLGNITGYDKKCNAMSSLIYYIHIFGDYLAMSESDFENYKSNVNKDLDMLPLYKENDNQNVLNEIESNLLSLFSTQKKDVNYSHLFSFELPEIKNKFVYVNNYEEYCDVCKELYDALSKYVPTLMKENEVFRNAFYKQVLDNKCIYFCYIKVYNVISYANENLLMK